MKKNISLIIALMICSFAFAQTTNLKAVTVIEQRSIHLNGKNKANFGGGKSATNIEIDLPANTVEWYYSFTTSGNQENINLASQIATLLMTASNIATSGGASLIGLTSTAAKSIKVPAGSHAMDISLYDSGNKYILNGSVQNTMYANVHVKNNNSGPYYLTLSNPALVYAVNIQIEVVAIVSE